MFLQTLFLVSEDQNKLNGPDMDPDIHFGSDRRNPSAKSRRGNWRNPKTGIRNHLEEVGKILGNIKKNIRKYLTKKMRLESGTVARRIDNKTFDF